MNYNENEVLEYLSTLTPNSFSSKKAVYENLQEKFPNLDYSLRQWRRRNEESDTLKTAIEQLVKMTTVSVVGKTVQVVQSVIDEDAVFEKAKAIWNRENNLVQLAESNVINIPTDQAIGIVFFADQHMGAGKETATDVVKMFEEVELVANTQNMFAALNGDLRNNFIGAWAANINNGREISIDEEVALANRYMKILLRDKVTKEIGKNVNHSLLAFCAGNHAYWSEKNSGLPELQYLQSAADSVLFDNDEIFFNLKTNYRETRFLMRHVWRGNSIHNITMGIERSAKNNNYLNAEVFCGAHYHSGGVVREFVNQGKTNYALQNGTYKKIDHYAKQNGFAKANETAAVGIIIHPKFGLLGYSNIYAMAEYLNMVN